MRVRPGLDLARRPQLGAGRTIRTTSSSAARALNAVVAGGPGFVMGGISCDTEERCTAGWRRAPCGPPSTAATGCGCRTTPICSRSRSVISDLLVRASEILALGRSDDERRPAAGWCWSSSGRAHLGADLDERRPAWPTRFAEGDRPAWWRSAAMARHRVRDRRGLDLRRRRGVAAGAPRPRGVRRRRGSHVEHDRTSPPGPTGFVASAATGTTPSSGSPPTAWPGSASLTTPRCSAAPR